MDFKKSNRKEWNSINSKILNHIHKKKFINYNEIDRVFGNTSGYFWKIANIESQSLSKVHTIALEHEFDIPKNIFFNPNLLMEDKTNIKYDEIDKIIRDFRSQKIFSIKNNFIDTVEAFKEYTHFYIYDNLSETKVVVREFKIEGTSVTLIQAGKVRGKGFIYITAAHIVIVVESIITGNTMILKIQRGRLAGTAFPVSYLGHSAINNREIFGYGICTKGPIDFKEARKILEIKKDKNIKISNIDRLKRIMGEIKKFENKSKNKRYTKQQY